MQVRQCLSFESYKFKDHIGAWRNPAHSDSDQYKANTGEEIYIVFLTTYGVSFYNL